MVGKSKTRGDVLDNPVFLEYWKLHFAFWDLQAKCCSGCLNYKVCWKHWEGYDYRKKWIDKLCPFEEMKAVITRLRDLSRQRGAPNLSITIAELNKIERMVKNG